MAGPPLPSELTRRAFLSALPLVVGTLATLVPAAPARAQVAAHDLPHPVDELHGQRLIQARGAQPTLVVGAFADKVIALPTETEQVVLLIKGQAWVVRKIDEIPPAEVNAEEKAFFADMREVHVVNIDKCKKLAS